MADVPRRVLVVMALEVESQGLFERAGVPVLYTGLGKVNAAIGLAKRLAELRHAGQSPDLVLNLGTAGSRTLPTGSLVSCREFVQRDMDVTGLGFALGETPFETWPAKLSFPKVFDHLPEGVCGTGDRFETGELNVVCDVIDMEAFAYAKACLFDGVPFASAKYVTDGANGSAAGDWQDNLRHASREFFDLWAHLAGRGPSNSTG